LQDIKDTYERKFKIKNRSNIFFNLNRIVSGKDYSFDDDVASSKAKLIGKLAEETAQKYFKDDSDLLKKKKKINKLIKEGIKEKLELIKLNNNNRDTTSSWGTLVLLNRLLRNYSYLNNSWFNGILKYNFFNLNKKTNLKFLIWKKFIFKKKLFLNVKKKKKFWK